MNKCFNCGYMWADLDEYGTPISNEYCHYPYDDNQAPCELDEPDDYIDEDEEFENYMNWIDSETHRELEEEWRAEVEIL